MSSAGLGGALAALTCFPFLPDPSLPFALAGESSASEPSGDPLRFFSRSLRSAASRFITDAGTAFLGTGLVSPRLIAAER